MIQREPATERLLRRIDDDLTAQRFETARRRCAELGEDAGLDLRLRWIDALEALADFDRAEELIEGWDGDDPAGELGLRRARLLLRRAGGDSFRVAKENAAGWCFEEYEAHYRGLARAALDEARSRLPADDERVAAIDRRLGLRVRAPRPPDHAPVPAGAVLSARIRRGGRPVVGRRVVVGVYQPHPIRDQEWAGDMGHDAPAPPCHVVETLTDSMGAFTLEDLPAGRAWIAVVLEADEDPIRTRFFSHEPELTAGERSEIELALAPWRSAPELPPPAVLDEDALTSWRFRNPFRYDFPLQAVHLELDPALRDRPLHLAWHDEPEWPLPYHVVDDRVLVMAELSAHADRVLIAWPGAAPDADPDLPLTIEDGVATIATGCAEFRIPWDGAPADAPPIAALRRGDGSWCGRGRWTGGVPSARRIELLDHGPLAIRFAVVYATADGGELRFACTAHRDQPYLLVTETSRSSGDLAFEFSLAEFIGGRGYLHWNREGGSLHWSDLAAEDRELARLQESVAWWIPPCGFGYAFGPDGLGGAGGRDEPDQVGVFTVRRGEWRDDLFESLAQGPGDERREWDWPYPEMIGSTVSMITAGTTADGDARFRFATFDGERRWGLMIGGFEQGDGPDKQLGLVQHACSSPRLETFVTWQLDREDALPRPCCVTSRDRLAELRRRIDDPEWARWWAGVKRDSHCAINDELIALLAPDPAAIWRCKQQLSRHLPVRAHRTLKGRDHGDMYSPVGGRPITPMAQRYDLVVGTGVFSPAEEREVRACLLLMGHAYLECDHMNWRYGGRNANFEADRVDIVGTVGIAFRGNPDADAFIAHAIERMAVAIDAYCTPGSGKWYENPACYYVHAMTCRLHLGILLARHGLMGPAAVPRLAELLRWTTLLITPPYPDEHEVMRDGCSADAWAAAEKIRKIPPIGDHADLGRRVPECLAVMASSLRASDPATAHDLWWTYLAGGGDGGHFAQHSLLFTDDHAPPLAPRWPSLPSRRLEGFGAIMRHKLGEVDEGYCLLKLGPGGYRYHRTEGSLVWFEHGVPLLFDGGEAGETWRHSTLSRGETRLPLRAGHLERWHFGQGLDFSQGVNPDFVHPGEPVYLSDKCDHELVAEAERRFNEPRPVNRRSVSWVHGEYLLLHDALDPRDDEPIHWHCQVVGGDAEHRADGWRVAGRFGVDLQVLLPDQDHDQAMDEHIPILDYKRAPDATFGMRHLQLTATRPEGFCALLRPLCAGEGELRARLHGGVRGAVGVAGEGIDDLHVHAPDGLALELGGVELDACYAAIRRRPDALHLALHGAGDLAAAGCHVTSDGPVVRVDWRADGSWGLRAEGAGTVTVDGETHPVPPMGLMLAVERPLDPAWLDLRTSRFV